MQRQMNWMRVGVLIGTCATLTVWSTGIAAQTEPAASAGKFVGDTRCANPTCHGAALPANEAQKKTWKPWKSARSQWLNRNIDHHSRAYVTLQNEASKVIAGYMGIQATASEKCLRCHAPAAEAAQGSAYKRSDGVTCEHCHGAAETWLKTHTEKDWKDKKKQFPAFYDNRNFKRRAEKCAECHVEIDHEIVAGGHPPLQFEMVAYADVMKHWDDQADQPEGAFSVDPTLWGVGQLVGLRKTMMMIEHRAGDNDYQGLKKFSHFESKNCYQCHHKLITEAMRQAHGHYEMVDALLSVAASNLRGPIAGAWESLAGAVPGSAEQTQQRAAALAKLAADAEDRILAAKVDRDAAKKILDRVTSNGEKYKGVRRFSFGLLPNSNTLRVDGVELPWWWTTGAPEQSILAFQSLCYPLFAAKCTSGGVQDDFRSLLKATNRLDYRADQYSQSLRAINKKLFP